MVVQWTKVKGLCPDDFCSTYPLHWRKTFSVHIIIQNMNLASQTFSVNIIIQIMNLASQSVQEKKKKNFLLSSKVARSNFTKSETD